MPPIASAPAPGRPGLRRWQQEALAAYESASPADYLVTATPGAGKTAFALALAQRLLHARRIDRVITVVPTDSLRKQWCDAAGALGIALDPSLPNSVGPVRAGMAGYATTYAQVAQKPLLHRRRTEARRTLVIFDEIHHAGDGRSWGEAVKEAFDPARRRLALTGTPFRTNPTERIPFVRYTDIGPDEVMSEADYTYGYREALADGVVRPVVFAAYAGTSRWLNSAGEVLAANLGEDNTRSVEDAAWRTALDPSGAWVPHVIAAVDDRISHLRQHGMPDAAGLILASDQDSARAYARIARSVTGHAPVLVLSDDPRASTKIEQFNRGTERLAVCVRMVSEGVDVPRAAVLGFLTSYRTPLFFAQAVGRVVRARSAHETATVFLPAVRPLLALAAEMEDERDHVVRLVGPASDELDDLAVERVATEPAAGDFVALDAQAEFAHVLHGGRAILAESRPMTEEDHDFLGLPGLLTPEQTASLLAARDVELRRRTGGLRGSGADAADPSGTADWRDADELRREISQLAAKVAARSGRAHAEIHIELRKAVPGPPSRDAPPDILRSRRDFLLGKAG